jgi:hypothetical protein
MPRSEPRWSHRIYEDHRTEEDGDAIRFYIPSVILRALATDPWSMSTAG